MKTKDYYVKKLSDWTVARSLSLMVIMAVMSMMAFLFVQTSTAQTTDTVDVKVSGCYYRLEFRA